MNKKSLLAGALMLLSANFVAAQHSAAPPKAAEKAKAEPPKAAEKAKAEPPKSERASSKRDTYEALGAEVRSPGALPRAALLSIEADKRREQRERKEAPKK